MLLSSLIAVLTAVVRVATGSNLLGTLFVGADTQVAVVLITVAEVSVELETTVFWIQSSSRR